jgi:uncharacterized protein (DUF427 family)
MIMRSDDDGFESVWDYPRPPRLELARHRLRVRFADRIIADTRAGYRALETNHPPTYYFPPSDVAVELLRKEEGRSLCEFKGIAEYMSIIVGDRIAPRAAWAYMAPLQAYAAVTGYIAFYPSRVDSCFVGAERVVAQQGDFYGGWITSTIRGPFKGGPGSASW